jgi:hypothetical protein
MHRINRLVYGALVLGAACGRASAEGTGDTDPEWTLSAEPTFSVGVADGDPNYQLFNVAGATRMSDGRVLVLNSGNSSVVAYDQRGRFLFSAGRKGQGPGEFEAPTWLGRTAGDTVVVWDERLKRLSFFTAAGAFSRSVQAANANGMFPKAVGLFGDHTLALDPGPNIMAMMQGERGIRRDSVTLHRLGPDGSRAGSLARYAGNEVHVADRATGFAWNDPPFARQSFAVVMGDRLYVGDSGSGEITLYSREGTRETVLRSPHVAWRVRPEDVEKYKAAQLAMIEEPERKREMETTLEESPVPEFAPAFGALLVDADQNIWVQAYPRPSEESVRWAVIGQDGITRASVEIQRAVKVLEIGRDYVLGLRRDDLGVEKIEMYALHRESGRQ